MKLSKYIKSSTLITILFFSLVNFTNAATISFFTSSKVYTVGSDIVLSLIVTNGDKPATAISGLISFPANLVSVSSISKDDSIVSQWVQEPSFFNSTGHINFESVLLSGFTKKLGKIFTITFKAKSAGRANINFIAGSILTADGIDNDILLNSDSALITISKTDSKTLTTSNTAEETKTSNIENLSSDIKSDFAGWYSLDSANFIRIPVYQKIPLVLIISILLFIFSIWYIYHNLSSKNNKLKKEVYEAEDALHKAFDILNESEEEQLEILDKKTVKAKLKVKKEKVKRQFKKDLEDAEKYIEKEISDIGK